MSRFIFTLVFIISFAGSGVHAQECTTGQDVTKIELADALEDLSRDLRKFTARADGQDLRIQLLPETAREGLSVRPDTPVLPDVPLDDGRAQLACGDGFDGAVAELEAGIESSRQAVSDYEAAIAAREEALTAAEDAAAGDASASGDQVSPDAGDGAAAGEATAADDDVPPDVDNEDGDASQSRAVAIGEEGAGDDADQSQDEASDDFVRRDPLPDPKNPQLFRRVISLPGATLTDDVGNADGVDVPTFSVLYVFDEVSVDGQRWNEVGSSLRDGSQGWVLADDTLDWSTMLVMQFSPKGQRRDVLFFEDSTTLSDIVNSPFHKAEVGEIYERMQSERARLAEDPGYDPQWDQSLVAVEPQTGVTFQNDPYLLPILDWRDETFDGAVDTVLLQVAAVPARATGIAARDTDSFQVDPGALAANDGEFRVGVVFVMDTTISMAPFIERTYETVEGFYNAFERFETSGFVSFGLVGFRDNIGQGQRGLDYVTQVFQPLDIEADSRQVLTNMRQMTEANVPTIGFQEDGLAGIMTAIEELDWTPYDARLVIFVTDASSRGSGDELAMNPDLNAGAVAEIGRNNGITIVPIHLKTPDNERLGDLQLAETQYRELAGTGDIATDKYFQIDGADQDGFKEAMDQVANTVVQGVLAANSGQLIQDFDMEPVPDASYGDDTADRMAAVVANEVFRAQLESLATVGDGDAPNFLAGWAADRDLTDPDLRTLEVSVFLTRNQLSTLDRRLDLIVEAFRSAEDDPGSFFDKLQILAAEMSTDPDAVRSDDRLAVETLLPTFLRNLPYRSEVLRLDREYWSSLSGATQQEFIENIEAKQRIYEETFSQTNLWRDFGAEDPGLQATPIRLTNLP